jgi:hypothetical protein
MIYVGQSRILPENGRTVIITEVGCIAKSDGRPFVRYEYGPDEGDWAGGKSWAHYEDLGERFD